MKIADAIFISKREKDMVSIGKSGKMAGKLNYRLDSIRNAVETYGL